MASDGAGPAVEPVSVTGVPRSVSLDRLAQRGLAVDRDGLAGVLRDGSLAERVEAAFLLGSDLPGGGPDAVGALRAALSDDDARVRVEAAYWLARAGAGEEEAHTL